MEGREVRGESGGMWLIAGEGPLIADYLTIFSKIGLVQPVKPSSPSTPPPHLQKRKTQAATG